MCRGIVLSLYTRSDVRGVRIGTLSVLIALGSDISVLRSEAREE